MRRFALAVYLVLLAASTTQAQAPILRVSFDDNLKAEKAAGKADPWTTKGVGFVPGKFSKAAHLPIGGQLVYAAEHNILAGRGTLAFWCRFAERPSPVDVRRLIFVQAKERAYWNYLATIEWQEGAFRAMVFDFVHGHGWHDANGCPQLTAETWHHLALVWDQAYGAKFFLDGKLVGSTWGRQAWWDRPSPHAIHLCDPGASYDELCIYDRALSDQEVGNLARDNKWDVPAPHPFPLSPWGSGGRGEGTLDDDARQRLIDSLGVVGAEHLPVVEATAKETVIRQARVRQILDDRIPSWKVMDGRMNLYWPEWRAPTLGDVDFSGSEIAVQLEPGQKPTHLLLHGLVGGCQVLGEKSGYVSRQPITEVPKGMHFLAASPFPPGLTGLRVPRNAGMKLHEIGVCSVESLPLTLPSPPGGEGGVRGAPKTKEIVTTLSGPVSLDSLGTPGGWLQTRTLPNERRVFGSGKGAALESASALNRIHFVTDPVAEPVPLDALNLRLTFVAPWQEDIWWLRVQDPVNPRRSLINVPVRVVNPSPGKEATIEVTLDHWDIMLDADARLWVELLPCRDMKLVLGARQSHLGLRPGSPQKVLAEFAHTQSQLAFSYWQLGSEGDGRQGSNPELPQFNMLGGITHNYELKITLEWIHRHAPSPPAPLPPGARGGIDLANNLWRITHAKRIPVAFKPRLQPASAPEWAVWGRDLLERYRTMAHHWADWQGPDGQLGGGWNDDPTLPGVFLCLPLLGDSRTQKMFERIFDGIENTGYLWNGVCRGPIDTGHARDLVAWRGHLMLFDYGEPRHVERALKMTKELERWTRLDGQGHRRGLTNHFSEDGPERLPTSVFNDDGLLQRNSTKADFGITALLMDSLFCAWYSRNPTVMKFVHEVAEGEYARAKKVGGYPFVSFAQIFNDRKYVNAPVDQYLLTDKDLPKLVQGVRSACEVLEGGWQFRGGEARGANDHFSVPGQPELSRMYLGFGMTWSRSAIAMIPPIAVSWESLEDKVAALVLESTPTKLRVAVYNFEEEARSANMRVWQLAAGSYRLHTGIDADGDNNIDGPQAAGEIELHRSSPISLKLPSQKVSIVELEQIKARPRRELLPDLAIGEGDILYDVASDRLKVVVHNIGAATAKNVAVRFEDPAGNVLAQQVIDQLEAPLDLQPKTATVWLSQPLLLPVVQVRVRVDPENQIAEITDGNNGRIWER